MSTCIRCSQPIDEDTNFCPHCGADQRIEPGTHRSATFLILLCVMTIIGSIFGVARAYLYEVVSTFGDGGYIRGWIYILSNVGTLAGAIMMVQRKMLGLYIYTGFQLVYIAMVVVATFAYDDTFSGSFIIASGVAAFFLIPSIAFLGMYWLKMNRDALS